MARGRCTKLITGAQKVEYALPMFIRARASLPIVLPVTFHSERLKLMAVVIGKANFVVSVHLSVATPVEASDHHLYVGRLRALIGQPSVPRLQIFSANVMRDTASAARSWSGTVTLQNGMVLCGDPGTMQGLYKSDGQAEPGGLLNGAVHGFGGGAAEAAAAAPGQVCRCS